MDLAPLIRTACWLEATARKAGNVHPSASFPDLTYSDFCRSADAVSEPLSRAAEIGVGRAILDAVQATRAAVGRNTNLGINLLIAPLAAVPQHVGLIQGIDDVLVSLTREDASLVYQAIWAAQPGGMGRVSEEDISQEPQGTLVEVMRLAADRDLIAAQYANGFEQVLQFGAPRLLSCADFTTHWESAIVGLQIALMAVFPDTLIQRKCGPGTALEAALRSHALLEAVWPGEVGHANSLCPPLDSRAFREFDAWLRADGNRRNPGTTADLITACLFAAFRDAALGHRAWPGLDLDHVARIPNPCAQRARARIS
jgi:triphosphoribosyl-dephospho-CoA synthase